MRLLLARSTRMALAGLMAATCVHASVAARHVMAQDPAELALDRWLVSERLELSPLDRESPSDPLAGPEGVSFPDRDLEVGPTYWTLVREDGVRGLDAGTVLAALDARQAIGDDAARQPVRILAHVYLKAPEDRTVLLDMAAPDCQAALAWLNGQRIAASGPPIQIRLAGGWNTLLVQLRESADCAPAFSAALRPGADTDEDDSAASATLTGIRAQASRPPGVRRQYPEAWVSVGAFETTEGLVWRAGAEDLTGTLRLDYAAWGRSPDAGGRGREGERSTASPAFDVTGTWDLSLFSPLGVQRATVDFRMAEDGTLEGRVEGREPEGDFQGGPRGEFGGNIEDGWVSGNRISFSLRFSAPRGRSVDTRLEGLVEQDFISGSIDFGDGGQAGARIGDFESRFEARRRPVGEGPGGPDPAGRDPEGGRRDPGDRPPLPGRGQGGRRAGLPGGLPGTGDQPSDEQLRARIRSQLLPPTEPTTPVPDTAAFELRLGGPRIYLVARDLEPGVARSHETEVPFKRLREVALSRDGAEVRLRWIDEERRLRRFVRSDGVLRALHGSIALTGWADEGGGRYSGAWRVPEPLAGFTIRLIPSADVPAPTGQTFSVDGRALTSGQGDLCSPCRRGDRLEVIIAGAAQPPDDLAAQIVEPGYPEAVDAAAATPGAPPPPATEWLEALRDDNRRYRDLAARHAGGG